MKKLYFLFISLLIINFTNAQWVQIGTDIDGEAGSDKSGTSVSLNSSGTIVAIGAPENDPNGPENNGHVRVYEYNGGNWNQLGDDIDGEAMDDFSGTSVSLNSNGTILAIGAPGNYGINGISGHVRIFEYNNNDWIQIGNDIDGENFGDYSGYSVDISSDGSIVAIGAPWSNGNDTTNTHRGEVLVYKLDSIGNWEKLGDDINGEDIDDYFGFSVNISSDGNILAIGAKWNDGNGNNSGHVRVYEYDGIGNWLQLGNDIEGEAIDDWSGYSVSLNSDGTIVAIGSPHNDIGLYSGHVRVFEFNGTNWIQKGNIINGESPLDNFGTSVCLDYDGSVIAIGADSNDGNGNLAGHTRIYNYYGSNWIQVGSDIDGEAVGDYSGSSVSLSSDGSIVAIGAIANDGNGVNSGHVRVFRNPSVGINENTINQEISVYPNPTTGLITIKNEECGINNVSVFDIYGKEVRSQKSEVGSRETEVDLSNQAKGIYVIKVQTDRGVVVEKVVLE